MMNQKAEDYVELENSKSEEYNIMRYSILANLMQILKENTHNEYPQNIFESGYTFKTGDSETGVIETSKIAVILCDRDADYTKAKQILGWEPKTSFEDLVKLMVDADIKDLQAYE